MRAKGIIALLMIVLLSITAAGCITIEVAGPEPPESGPELKVVFVEEALREYIRQARANAGDWDALYDEIVLDPIREEMAARGSRFRLDDYQKPIHSLDDLEYALDLMAEYNVASIVEDTIKGCNQYFQGVDTTVFIFPCNPEDSFTRDRMRGVRGLTGLSCGTTIISINPTAEGWQETLPYVAAHEYHHAAWGMRYGHQFEGCLLDVLVMEGRADSFANLVCPGLAVPWTSSLSKDMEREIWWNQVKDDLYSTDLDAAKRLTQDEHWSGYAIGYHIVQAFLENFPDLSADQWTEITIPELYENSGYEDWLETE